MEFQHVLADSTPPWGPDVSGHQGPGVDWGKIAQAGAQFAIIKVSEGSSFVDPWAGRNIQRAQAAGLLVGFYHFMSHDIVAQDQIKHLRDTLGALGVTSLKGYLPIMLDVEPDPSSVRALKNKHGGAYGTSYPWQAMVRLCDDCQTYVKDYFGEYAPIYTYPDWWQHYMGNTQNYKNACPLWLAAYPTIKWVPGGWAFASFHQYSDNSIIYPGGPEFDLNTFNGSRAQLLKFVGV